jgi:hypothetical protein
VGEDRRTEAFVHLPVQHEHHPVSPLVAVTYAVDRTGLHMVLRPGEERALRIGRAYRRMTGTMGVTGFGIDGQMPGPLRARARARTRGAV